MEVERMFHIVGASDDNPAKAFRGLSHEVASAPADCCSWPYCLDYLVDMAAAGPVIPLVEPVDRHRYGRGVSGTWRPLSVDSS